MKKVILSVIILLNVIASAQTPSLLWVKQMGSSLYGSAGNSLVLDAANNVYTTGSFSGTADFDPSSTTFNLTATDTSGNDLFICKLDASGNFIWAKSMGGSGVSHAEGESVLIDAMGNIYITGNFGGTIDFNPGTGTANITSVGGSDVFILKLDASGNFIWIRSMGGSSDDYAASMVIDGSGNICTTGSFSGTADFNPGTGIFNLISSGVDDIFISKLDASGNFVWAKSMGGSSDDNGYSITADASSNIYVTGRFEGTGDFNPGSATFDLICTGFDAAFVSKLDASGNFIWAKKMDGSYDWGSSIITDASENVYTMGFFSGTVDFDPGPGTFNLSGGNMFISKLDVSGNFLWAKSIGEGSLAQGLSITLDASGNIYTTGSFAGMGDFDPGPGTFYMDYPSAIGFGMFISKLNASGDFVWAVNMDGYSWGNAIAVDASDQVYTTGFFSGTTDFDPGSGVADLLVSNGSIFIHKMGQTPSGINEYDNSNYISIYPNPTNGIFNLKMNELNNQKINELKIYNVLSECVYQLNASQINSSSDLQIDLTDQTSGIYFVKVMSDDKIVSTKKIIKE